MDETKTAEDFLSKLDIRCQRVEDINYRDIPCDFIGADSDNWYIVEVKASKGDCEKSILQIIRYYDALKWSKYNQNAPVGYRVPMGHNIRIYSKKDTAIDYAKLNHKTKDIIPCGKKEIKLFILYTKQVDLGNFEQYHTLFKTYLDNPNCPKIDFYYLNENELPVKL